MGNDAFTATKSGSFLVGWYAERTETGKDAEGNPVYTYAKPWDFSKDTLQVAADGSYTSAEPELTLYAAWAPRLEVQFYLYGDESEALGSYAFDPADIANITVPAWSEETGAMEMYKFPERAGYTFEKAYYDAAGTQPVDTATLQHPAKINYENGTVENAALKVYLDWTEGEWYHIYNIDQFLDNASVSGSYVLHTDLDFADEVWPTSLMYGNFSGKIQGNGHTIRNVTVTQTNNSKTSAGLFGHLTDTAALTDLTLSNITFTIKSGTRVAGTTYGLLTGTLSAGADLTGLTITDSHLQIDSGCYFGADDYVIGLICGAGDPGALEAAIDWAVVGDQPDRLTIEVNGNTVTLKFVE